MYCRSLNITVKMIHIFSGLFGKCVETCKKDTHLGQYKYSLILAKLISHTNFFKYLVKRVTRAAHVNSKILECFNISPNGETKILPEVSK